MRIETNNVPRSLIAASELSEDERLSFDYIDWDAIDREDDDALFFRYRGWLYSLGEFEHIGDDRPELKSKGWNGILPTSAFSAVVIKFVEDDNDYAIIGSVYV